MADIPEQEENSWSYNGILDEFIPKIINFIADLLSPNQRFHQPKYPQGISLIFLLIKTLSKNYSFKWHYLYISRNKLVTSPTINDLFIQACKPITGSEEFKQESQINKDLFGQDLFKRFRLHCFKFSVMNYK